MQSSVVISSPIRQSTTVTTNYPAGTSFTRYASPVRTTIVSPARVVRVSSPSRVVRVSSPSRVVRVSSPVRTIVHAPVVTSYVSPIRTRVYHPATVTTTTTSMAPVQEQTNFVPDNVSFVTPNQTERQEQETTNVIEETPEEDVPQTPDQAPI